MLGKRAENDHRFGPARLLSKQVWEAEVELKISGTESLQIWCSPHFQCSQLARSHKE